MDINLKITLPTQDELTDYCKALGWAQENPLTKRQFFNQEILKYIRTTVKNYRLQKVGERQASDRNSTLKTIIEAERAEKDSLIATQDSLPIVVT